MGDSIINRLLKDRKKRAESLKESMSLYEADADEEYEDLNDEEVGVEDTEDIDIPDDSEDFNDEEGIEGEDTIEDDSTAPEQGSLEDPAPSSSSSLPNFSSAEEGSPEGELEETPPEEDVDSDTEEYENPLDNNYAVHFTLGSEVSLIYNGDTQESRKGVIDGYDTEGFYRVRWSDGSTTSGLTDIALEELVTTHHTNECVCGGTHFVTEGKEVVCDKCGRPIREGATLLAADKDRPKGKKIIRSEAHPISTAVRPSIAESIKKAFLRSTEKVNEDYDDEDVEDTEVSVFDRLRQNLENEFWTRQNEMVEDIEELGYTVEEINGEYVVVSSDEDEDNAYQIFIGGTSRTMTLDFSRARMV